MNVMPVVGRGVGRIDAERFDSIDQLQTRSTFGQPDRRKRISPPGLT